MNDVTNYQGQVLNELDELFVALSEKLIFEGELDLPHDDILLKVTFEQDIDRRLIFIDTLLNGEKVISSRYDNNDDYAVQVFKKPLNKDELEKIADAVSEIREELE